MTPIRNNFLSKISDLLTANQTSNGVYPVSSSMSYVYVLRNTNNGGFYTGFTFDLKKRLTEHLENKTRSTNKRGPYQLIYYEACLNSTDARAREKFLKTGPGKRYLKNRVKRFLELMG
ncbi:MAG: GIY-YIG nuclease superfamily protein [Candidatus Saccharibacteria bacterium GW2011_GWA2_46_10]|nr:MAG: GIY-YIG nuclease superfamily protein [Candidatus Saccharibacteria bacterium GW2011_GWA2_46_10]